MSIQFLSMRYVCCVGAHIGCLPVHDSGKKWLTSELSPYSVLSPRRTPDTRQKPGDDVCHIYRPPNVLTVVLESLNIHSTTHYLGGWQYRRQEAGCWDWITHIDAGAFIPSFQPIFPCRGSRSTVSLY
jgi:hypothetical protein